MFKKLTIFVFLMITIMLCNSCIFFGKKKIPVAVTDAAIAKEAAKGTRETIKNLDAQGSKVIGVKDHIILKIGDIKEENIKIKSNAENGKKDAPQMPVWSDIIKSTDIIKEDSTSIEKKVGDLVDVNTSLKLMGGQLENFIKQIQKVNEINKILSGQIREKDVAIKKQNDDLANYKDGSKKRQEIIWMMVEALAALLLVGGVIVTAYVDKKTGIALIASALFIASIAYFMAAYAWIVAIFGGIVFFCAFAYIGYCLYVNRKDLEIRQKALEQSVKSFEVIKNIDWDASNDATNHAKEKVDLIQSPETKKLVNEIKLVEGIK